MLSLRLDKQTSKNVAVTTFKGLHKKPFEAPQRGVKIKILVNSFSWSGIGTRRVKVIGSSLLFPNIGFQL